jgi:hypothetical protein
MKRICCGEEHMGVQCPDGLVMCCLCFERFPVSELHEIRGGRGDVCKGCAEKEDERWASTSASIVRIVRCHEGLWRQLDEKADRKRSERGNG